MNNVKKHAENRPFLTAQITNLFSFKGKILLSVMFLKVVEL